MKDDRPNQPEFPLWTSQFLREGCRHNGFAELLNGSIADRAYAVASLSLARVAELDPPSRFALYARIACAPRSEVLSELSALDIRPPAIRALRRLTSLDFAPDQWRQILWSFGRTHDVRALSAVEKITPSLIKQFEAIPQELRSGRLLSLAASFEISEGRWLALRAALTELPKPQRDDVIRRGRLVRGRGELWDLLLGPDRLGLKGQPPDLGSSFVALTTPAAVRREGRDLDHCLKRLVPGGRDGRSAYYHSINPGPYTVELRSENGDDWSIAAIAGLRNARPPQADDAAMRCAIEDALGNTLATAAPPASVNPDTLLDPGPVAARTLGRDRFDPQEIAKIVDALHTIAGHANCGDDFFVVQLRNTFYAQCISVPPGDRILLEFCSHRWVPEVEDLLTEDSVSFLLGAGFGWPMGQANFTREFLCRDDNDRLAIAEVLVSGLSRLYDYRCGSGFSITQRATDLALPCLDPANESRYLDDIPPQRPRPFDEAIVEQLAHLGANSSWLDLHSDDLPWSEQELFNRAFATPEQGFNVCLDPRPSSEYEPLSLYVHSWHPNLEEAEQRCAQVAQVESERAHRIPYELPDYWVPFLVGFRSAPPVAAKSEIWNLAEVYWDWLRTSRGCRPGLADPTPEQLLAARKALDLISTRHSELRRSQGSLGEP